ncbi:hypothetical protein IGK74_002334, partial [Enterococcus sp. AZ150]
VITKSYELREDAVGYMNEYADGIKDSAEKAIEANKKIVESIESTIKKEKERKEKAADGLYSDDAKDRAKDEIEYQNKLDEGTVKSAKQATDRINEIIKSASDNKRTISDAEREYISANYSKLSEAQLKAADFSNDQILAIQTAYQDKLSDLSTKQMQDRAERITDALDKEQSYYEDQKNKLAEIYGEGTENYKRELSLAEEAHKQSNESMVLGLAKLTVAQGFSLEQMSGAWEKYGWTTEEVGGLVFNNTNKISENLDMMAKGISEADMQWNEMALDPKTGEIKTNMAETLQELAKTEEGWRQLKMLSKEANISSNAKEEVGVAMGLVGKWNEFFPTEQLLLVDGDEAKLTMFNLIDELGKWNEFNADRKVLGIDNADAIWKLLDSKEKIEQWESIKPEDKQLLADDTDFLSKLATSKDALDIWDSLSPEDKKLLADDTDFLNKLTSSKENLDIWNTLTPEDKILLADNEDLLSKVATSSGSVQAWNELPLQIKMMLADNQDVLTKVSDGTISIGQYNEIEPFLKFLLGDASGVVTAANDGGNALNIYDQNNPGNKYLNAIDNASGPAKTAYEMMSLYMRDIPPSFTTRINAEFIGPKYDGKATGDPYFQGGPVWLGDGGKAEPYLTPDGKFGISPADWTMYNLPRGTKIWPSVQKMMQSLPRYAEGTKFDSTAISSYSFNGGSGGGNNMERLIGLLERFFSGEQRLVAEGNVYIQDTQVLGKVVAPDVQKTNNYSEMIRNKIKGGG